MLTLVLSKNDTCLSFDNNDIFKVLQLIPFKLSIILRKKNLS